MSSSSKTATLLIGLSIAAVAGVASVASATPIDNHGALVSDVAQGGGSYVGESETNHGAIVSDVANKNYQGTTAVQSVPEPSALLLLGVGLFALAAWHRWYSLARAER